MRPGEDVADRRARQQVPRQHRDRRSTATRQAPHGALPRPRRSSRRTYTPPAAGFRFHRSRRRSAHWRRPVRSAVRRQAMNRRAVIAGNLAASAQTRHQAAPSAGAGPDHVAAGREAGERADQVAERDEEADQDGRPQHAETSAVKQTAERVRACWYGCRQCDWAHGRSTLARRVAPNPRWRTRLDRRIAQPGCRRPAAQCLHRRNRLIQHGLRRCCAQRPEEVRELE